MCFTSAIGDTGEISKSRSTSNLDLIEETTILLMYNIVQYYSIVDEHLPKTVSNLIIHFCHKKLWINELGGYLTEPIYIP